MLRSIIWQSRFLEYDRSLNRAPATVSRAWRMRRKLFEIVRHATRFRAVRVRPWILVVHKFMDRDELSTRLGKERLQSCVFRVPVHGRMVSMCELNATDLRLQLNRVQRETEGLSGSALLKTRLKDW